MWCGVNPSNRYYDTDHLHFRAKPHFVLPNGCKTIISALPKSYCDLYINFLLKLSKLQIPFPRKSAILKLSLYHSCYCHDNPWLCSCTSFFTITSPRSKQCHHFESQVLNKIGTFQYVIGYNIFYINPVNCFSIQDQRGHNAEISMQTYWQFQTPQHCVKT